MRKRGANSAFQGGETKQDDDNEEDFDEYLAETILKWIFRQMVAYILVEDAEFRFKKIQNDLI